MLKINKKFKLIILAALSIIVLIAVFFIIKDKLIKDNSYKMGLPSVQNEKDKGLFVISGVFSCLPVKDINKPHNDLCVFGIKVNNDDYYRLQSISDDKNNVVNKTKKGQKIEISGTLIKDDSDIYKTLGTIKVSGIRHLYTEEKDIESYLPDSFKANYISFLNYVLLFYLQLFFEQ